MMKQGVICEETNQSGWKLDRTISPANLIALLVLAVAFARWTSTLERSINQNETVIKHVVSTQVEEKQRVDVMRKEFKGDLSAIKSQLDRLLEYQYKK